MYREIEEKCTRCKNVLKRQCTICEFCGHVSGFFEVPQKISEEWCFAHSWNRAVKYCVHCTRPICRHCIEREGMSLVSLRPTTACRSCVAKINKLEDAYFTKNRVPNCCSMHATETATASCVVCKTLLCKPCNRYLRQAPFFLKKGPFCLSCFHERIT